ncbi:MAG: FHA domain-containing protein [Kiritimatiellae bacterium]|nr:FHA domain-containing protein [Kiritimatiellia bacterium]
MSKLELQIANGEFAGQRYAVGPGGLRLGRSSSNDIHINDEELSRNHCFFEAEGETGLRVTDLASANGTVLNGRVIGGDPEALHAGDR